MPMDELTLQYRGVTVTLADQPDAGHGALGAEDIVTVQLPDGTALLGAALAQQLADPAFRDRVVGVIDAYGPVLSTPFHQTGADEWPRLRSFWTTAQPEHWLRDIGRYPDLADDRQVLTRTMFLRANRSTKLPPALQEAVAVQQAIGWIHEQHRTRLGLARLDTLVDQAAIDAHLGPVVRTYTAAVSALIRRQGASPLTQDLLATTAWRDPTVQAQIPPWAIEYFPDLLPQLALLTLWSTGPEAAFAEGTQLEVYDLWYNASDVAPLAQALHMAVATRPQLLSTNADFLLDLAFAIHDRLPTATERDALGDTIVDLLRQCEEFNSKFREATAQSEPTGPRIEAMLDTLTQYRYGNRTEDARIAARYTRWRQFRGPRIPREHTLLLDMQEYRHMELGTSLELHLLTLDDRWLDRLTPTEAQILADQCDVWWRRDAGRAVTGNMHPAVSLLYHLHNRLPTQAERERWSLRIADDIAVSRPFSLAYAVAQLHRLSEPTGSQLAHVLATALQSPDVDRRHEAELAQMLTRRATPRGLLQMLQRLAPTAPVGTNISNVSIRAKTSRFTNVTEVEIPRWFTALTDLEIAQWFTGLTESELARLSERLLQWSERDPESAWRNDRDNDRGGLLARIHNATAHPPLRDRIARFLVSTMQQPHGHYRALRLVEDFHLEEPARGEILGVYRALQADPDIAAQRAVQAIELALGADLIGAALARAGDYRHLPRDSLAEPELVAAGYPLLTAEERTRLDHIVMAALTFDQADAEGAAVQASVRRAFHPLRNQVSPALRRVLTMAPSP